MNVMELNWLAYDQDSKFGQVLRLVDARDHSKAKKMKKFLDKEWSVGFAEIVDMTNRPSNFQNWDVAVNQILGWVNRDLYPQARKLGFPEWSFSFPDITIEGVGIGAPFGSFVGKLRNLLSTKEAREIAPFAGPAGVIALDVANDLLASAKSGDPAAVKSLEDIHRDAKKGDPAAKDAVKTLAVVDKAQTKKAEEHMSLYERGVSVGHLPYHIGGRPELKRPRSILKQLRRLSRRGTVAVGDDRDHRKASGGRSGGGVRVTQGANRSAARSRKHTQTYRLPDGSLLRYGYGDGPSSYHMPAYGAMGQENPWKTFVPFQGLNRNVLGRTPTSLSQGGGGYGDTGVPVPSGTDGMGNVVDQYGNPIDPGGYGGSYEDIEAMSAYEDMEGLDYGLDPYELEALGYGYDPYADLYNAPTGAQTYDPLTDSFYSDTARQAYDPETDSFYPV